MRLSAPRPAGPARRCHATPAFDSRRRDAACCGQGPSWRPHTDTASCLSRRACVLLSRARAGPAARPGGRARLDGELAVSRALGDAPYRGRGLSAEPELAAWLALGPADAALLLASDGVLEALPAAAACRIAHAVATGAPTPP